MKWYEKNSVIILLLIVFFPIGIPLMWIKAKWNKRVKWIVSGIVAVFVIISLPYVKLNQNADIIPSSISSSNTQEESKESNMQQVSQSSSGSEPSSKLISSSPIASSNTAPEVEVTQLFSDIYIKYAKREKSFDFNSVKSFVTSSQYKTEITEPEIDVLGKITVKDDVGDTVFFAFTPNSSGIQMIMTVTYFHSESNSEVSLSNYSTDSSPQYDSFATHVIGEERQEVSGINEQIDFLFN